MNIVKNQFDPQMMVVVVDVTKNVPPDTLHYNMRDKDKTMMTVEPSFDEFGDPLYQIPRFYAERLLQNLGGRTFRLVSPSTLIIRMPNGRGGTDLKTIKASHKCKDGEWRELTDKEIAEIEADSFEDDQSDESTKDEKAEKVPGMSKRGRRSSAPKPEENAPVQSDESTGKDGE